jgi:hypothetical protein
MNKTTEGNMAASASSSKTKDLVKDVLFQKIGNTWFIFSEVNNEVVYSVMPTGMDPKTTKLELFEIIEKHMTSAALTRPQSHSMALKKQIPTLTTPQEKQLVETLIKRLNERFLRDPKACQKAALILESWINKKKRP